MRSADMIYKMNEREKLQLKRQLGIQLCCASTQLAMNHISGKKVSSYITPELDSIGVPAYNYILMTYWG